MRHTKEQVWYSWIPTNLGELNLDYFGKSKELEGKYKKIKKTSKYFYIKKLDISSISDTYTPLNKWLDPLTTALLPSYEKEVYGNVDFFICKKQFFFSSKIRLSYPEHFVAQADLDVDFNGKLKIFNLVINPNDKNIWDEFESYEHFRDYLAQVIFIIIKSIIHGDNHHHQKIDTAITVNRDSFNPQLIIENLCKHIKRVEHDIKNFDRCYGELKAKNAIEEMKGYKSYINTFRSLFIPKDNPLKDCPIYVSDPTIIDNIIISLESSVKKSQNKPMHRFTIISTMLIYAAAVISAGILYLNMMKECYSPIVFDFDYYIVYIAVLSLIAIFHLRCTIASFIFYNFYNFYEYLFHLTAIEKPKGAINKTIKFLWINKYALLSLIGTMLLFVITKT